MTSNTRPYITVKNISSYIAEKRYIESHIFIVTAHGNFYVQDGIRVPANEFEKGFNLVLDLNRIAK